MTNDRSQPPDQEFRDRISTDLDGTMLVEAAAGTGKTTCLITRMVGLLREGKCRIDGDRRAIGTHFGAEMGPTWCGE